MAFYQANHITHSNPSTQLGAHNKRFGAGLQTDLTRGLVLSVVQANMPKSEDTL